METNERYLVFGASEIGDAELLALVLGTGRCTVTSVELARRMLDRHGGLSGLARADAVDLLDDPALTPRRAVRVHAALALGNRALRATADLRDPVVGPAGVFALMGPALADRPDEELHALYLDARQRPICHRVLTRGSDRFTIVDPRQVFRTALAVHAHRVVLAHNHPSGDPTPSIQDHEITRRVARAGEAIGVPLVDHLVVGGGRFVSLAEEGVLSPWIGDGARCIAGCG